MLGASPGISFGGFPRGSVLHMCFSHVVEVSIAFELFRTMLWDAEADVFPAVGADDGMDCDDDNENVGGTSCPEDELMWESPVPSLPPSPGVRGTHAAERCFPVAVSPASPRLLPLLRPHRIRLCRFCLFVVV